MSLTTVMNDYEILSLDSDSDSETDQTSSEIESSSPRIIQ
jgi:hypothetical protein